MKRIGGLLRTTARWALQLGVVVLSGCASFTPHTTPGPEPAANYVPLTLPFIAMGDTQEHLSTGYPLHDNDNTIDAYVEVTQRPPEQALFGRRVMEWALQVHTPEPYLHLGDVMDLSCRIEADRVTKVFRASGRTGAILPGNHDGLMFGIYGYHVLDATLDADARKWHKACRRGAALEDKTRKTPNEAFSKRDFISLYIAEHARIPSEVPGLRAPPLRGEHRVSWRNSRPDVFLSALEANLLEGFDYADSFLAQRLKLPRAPGATRDVIIVGLDTNQAGPLVSTWDTILGRSPGSVGHVHADQVRAVTKWVTEAARQGDMVVFAGHHNWRALGLPTRVMLRELMSKVRHPLVYLSAHTHSGFWAVHRELDRRPLLEMNVSSLSDWPIAYRRISFAYDEKAERLQVRAELMPRGDKPITSYADLLAAWEDKTCAASGIPIEVIKAHDLGLVKRQREARGSLIEWLVSALGPICETCEQPLYAHADAYQDDLLLTLLQGSEAVQEAQIQLPTIKLPAHCGAQSFDACASALLEEKATDFKGRVDLFRRKAELVATINDALDDIDAPRAKAYMTCRAVVAAKIDFDATDDSFTENRGEAKRRAEEFFRVEASIGMQ
jgi:hypothetical protein